MPEFRFPIRVVYHEAVTVEAEDAGAAKALIEGMDFNVEHPDLVEWERSDDPDIEVEDE